jgi:hypothetical protein
MNWGVPFHLVLPLSTGQQRLPPGYLLKKKSAPLSRSRSVQASRHAELSRCRPESPCRL